MPNPTITPSGAGYSVANSTRVHADLSLSFFDPAAAATVQVTFAPPVAAATVTLERAGGAVVPITFPAPAQQTANITNRHIVWQTTGGGATLDLAVDDQAGANLVINEPWILKISGLAAGVTVNVQPGNNAGVTAIEADPFIEPVLALQNAGETQMVQLEARAKRSRVPATGAAACSEVTSDWAQTGGSISVMPGMGVNLATTLSDGITPACLRREQITIPALAGGAVDLVYTCTATSGVFTNTTTATVHATPRRHCTLLVLDRSGSMGGTKWANTVKAAHIWLDLYVALRQGLDNNERVGIEVFEDSTYPYHVDHTQASIAAATEVIFPPPAGSLKALPSLTDLNTINLGAPGDNTNLGDAIIRGLNRMVALGGVAAQTVYTVLLMTDGYENTGTVRVSSAPEPTAPPLLDRFDNIKSNAPRNLLVFTGTGKNVWFYTVGVGALGSVEEDVLSDLAYGDVSAPLGYYRLISDSGDLFSTFGEALTNNVNGMMPVVSGSPMQPDPEPGGAGPAAYFHISAGDRKLAIVLTLSAAGQQMEVRKRASGTNGAFESVSVTQHARGTHITSVIDLTAGNLNATGTEWRVRRMSGANPQTLSPAANKCVIAARDLNVRTEIVFDRAQYSTGQPMKIEARIGAGSQPVTGAKVVVELAAPGEGFGTFLATAAQQFQVTTIPQPPPQPVVTTSTTGAPQRGFEPPTAKLALFQYLLERSGKAGLAVVTPPGFFIDGTNRLHDDGAHDDGPAGNGRYANTFANTFKEGTYTFRFTVSGNAPDGSAFSDTFTVSRWVGVDVDAVLTTLTFQGIASPHRGYLAAQVTVVPKDKRGEYLGPFRTPDIRFTSTNGVFQGDTISHPDGSYTRTLLYPEGTTPQVKVYVQGKEVGHSGGTDGKGGCGCLAVPILGPILDRLARLFGVKL
ncbi:MAG TPA: vWA domain-containing protein [Pyrinomonadaceae bacterium]|jgi:hypothetical protein